MVRRVSGDHGSSATAASAATLPDVPSFDFTKPILILSPHLVTPPRNGADILVERSARWLSTTCPGVTVLGAEETITYLDGVADESSAAGSGMRPRGASAARTIAMRSHYYRERFLTSSFRERADEAITRSEWGGIICSYLTTAEVTEGSDVAVAVWTHNDEFQWFDDLTDASVNPIARKVATQSLAYLGRHGNDLADKAVLMHVTEADAAGFRKGIGDHAHVVVPIGTDVDVAGANASGPPDKPARLLFVGSLSVQMNADALRHFATTFASPIADGLPGTSIVVAGSKPSREVATLCEDHGWALIANPTDGELDELYMTASFAILPFPYATGAKLKLLASLAHGVPFLASASVDVDPGLLVAPSTVSDDPDDWVAALRGVASRGISADEREALTGAAAGYSWEQSVRILVAALDG